MEAQNSRLRMGEADCAKVTDKLKKREIEGGLLLVWIGVKYDCFDLLTQFACRAPSRDHGKNVTAARQKH